MISGDPKSIRVHDQRGLSRGLTASEEMSPWLRTPLTTARRSFELLTCRHTQALVVLNAQWQLWFRDLPFSAGVFKRERSPANEGVNDTQADSGSWNFLQGYEWRLAKPNGDGHAPQSWLP